MMRLSNMAAACNGCLHGNDASVMGVSIDSRADCSDRLFIALKGDNFDAHDFVKQAANNGATALLLEKDVDSALPKISVESCHQALQELAAWRRDQYAVPVIGITGSVGKTSVKEMAATIFAGLGQGLVTQGNFNNEIGLPLTLMRFSADDQYAIIEMGMNHAGEIARLTNIARPTIALINNAGAAHLEGLGTVAAVAEAKGEIFQGLAADGVAIINADDRHAQLWLGLAEQHQILTFGLDNPADVSGRCEMFLDHSVLHIEHDGDEFSLRVPVPGKHNVANALAAVAVARAANVPNQAIIKGLEAYQPINGRLNIHRAGQLTVIDDTYNANPASMTAAIEVLAKHEQTTLIVGDMGELGVAASAEHKRMGELAANAQISKVLASGMFASDVITGFAQQGSAFDSQQALLEYLEQNPIMAGTVLVKGSRSAQMERVVEHLINTNAAQAQLDFAEGGH